MGARRKVINVVTKAEGETAISQLGGKEIDGRALTVNEAKPREDRPRSGGGYASSGGGNRRSL